MKRTIGLLLALFAVVAASSSIVLAQTNHGRTGINGRQQNQQKRIAQGVRSGELTARETLRLEREQAKINRIENKYRDSGNGLSLRERVKLERDLNRSSRDIYRQKHDKQDYPKHY